MARMRRRSRRRSSRPRKKGGWLKWAVIVLVGGFLAWKWKMVKEWFTKTFSKKPDQ